MLSDTNGNRPEESGHFWLLHVKKQDLTGWGKIKGIRSAMRIGIQQMMRRWVKGLGSTHTSIR